MTGEPRVHHIEFGVEVTMPGCDPTVIAADTYAAANLAANTIKNVPARVMMREISVGPWKEKL